MATKRNPDRVFHPYVVNVTKKTLRLEEFMAANKEDEMDFGAWRLATLETHITSLKDQVSRMETDWDVMRDDTMSATVFNKISQLVDESMATADVPLTRRKSSCVIV
jgi:hypothetical protein